MSAAEVTRLCDELLEVLEYLHGRDVVHRDIKPDNVVIAPDGGAHLVDFGAARRLHVAGKVDPEPTVVGTPGYMAPEQARGELVPQSDLYALGRLLTEALGGARGGAAAGGAAAAAVQGKLAQAPRVGRRRAEAAAPAHRGRPTQLVARRRRGLDRAGGRRRRRAAAQRSRAGRPGRAGGGERGRSRGAVAERAGERAALRVVAGAARARHGTLWPLLRPRLQGHPAYARRQGAQPRSRDVARRPRAHLRAAGRGPDRRPPHRDRRDRRARR